MKFYVYEYKNVCDEIRYQVVAYNACTELYWCPASERERRVTGKNAFFARHPSRINSDYCCKTKSEAERRAAILNNDD